MPTPDAAADAILHLKKDRPLYCNAQIGPKEIRAYCKPSDEVKGFYARPFSISGCRPGRTIDY